MRIVVALGGNALLKRGEPMTAEVQRKNVKTAAQALARHFHDAVRQHEDGAACHKRQIRGKRQDHVAIVVHG